MGLENYARLFSADLPKYFGKTMLMWLIGFVPQIVISLMLAAWFTDVRLKLRCQAFFKTVIYMPNLIMASAFSMLFFTLFSDNGPVNAALMSMGVTQEPFRFLPRSRERGDWWTDDELSDVVWQHHHPACRASWAST